MSSSSSSSTFSGFAAEKADHSRSVVTKKNYEQRYRKFVKWLKEYHQEVLRINSDGKEEIIFDSITGEIDGILFEYISRESHSQDGSLKNFSTPEGIHSMIVYIYGIKDFAIPEAFKKNWLSFAKGYRNDEAREKTDGHVTKGSDKLNFEQYKGLALLAAGSNFFHCHAFLLLGWNLMSRSGTTGLVKYKHLSMDGDHINVEVPSSKGDPSGDR